MARTVVALVHDIDEAQCVVHDLVASGIQREDIGFRGNEGHAIPSTAALNESEGSVEDVSSDAIVVAVAAETDAQAQSAIEVMKRHGATDIDQRATEWKKQVLASPYREFPRLGRSFAAAFFLARSRPGQACEPGRSILAISKPRRE